MRSFAVQYRNPGLEWVTHCTYVPIDAPDPVGPETRAVRHAIYWSDEVPDVEWRVVRLDPVWTYELGKGVVPLS